MKKVWILLIVLILAPSLFFTVLACANQGKGMLDFSVHENPASPYYSNLELSIESLKSPQFVGDEFESSFSILNTGETFEVSLLETCWREDLRDEWIHGSSSRISLETNNPVHPLISPFNVSHTGYESTGIGGFKHDGTYTYKLYVFDYASVMEATGNANLSELSRNQLSKLIPIKTITGSVVVYDK